jgi:phosphatidate cytidylyltransferase
MLRTRVLTGSILGAILLLGLFMLPSIWAVTAFGAVFSLAAWEWAGFGALSAPAARALYAAVMVAIFWATWIWTVETKHLILMLAAACAWWVIAGLWLSMAPQRHRPLLVLLCGVAVLTPAFAALARMVASARGFAPGPQIVLWLVLMVCAADIGAYFAGRRFGRRKLAPRVSPGKTWEGAIGGLVMVCIVACAGAAYFSLPIHLAVVFGCGIGIFSIIGDLTESMFKRAAALKDSGTILPGHGGLLDRLDSVTAAAPLYALGLFGAGVIR